MKKKGFTLIELLAVIVILAIIALIATPIVMNVIENSKKGAAERSAENYLRAVELAIANEILSNGNLNDGLYNIMPNGNICSGGLNENSCIGREIVVSVNGQKPISGIVNIEDRKVEKIYNIRFGEMVILEVPLDSKKYSKWDGSSATTSDKLEIDETNKVVSINSAADLAGVRNIINTGGLSGYSFNLTTNIDLDNHEWTPIGIGVNYDETVDYTGHFKGKFDGNEYTIKGIKITNENSSNNGVGFFGAISGNTEIRNLNLIGNVTSNGKTSGGLIGFIIDTASSSSNIIIDNCSVDIDVSGVDAVGGIIARVYNTGTTTITNSKNIGDINANIVQTNRGKVSGFVGIFAYGNLMLDNCKNMGNITGGFFAGGLLGYIGTGAQEFSIINCVNNGYITSKIENNDLVGNTVATTVGGIVGNSYESSTTGSVENCVNNGRILNPFNNPDNYPQHKTAGGIIAQNNSKISINSCTNNSIVESGDVAGGIVGISHGGELTAENCNNNGLVVSERTAGGVVGIVRRPTLINNCKNSAIVQAATYGGGVIGRIDNKTLSNYSGVTIKNSSGGSAIIMGENAGRIVGIQYIINGSVTITIENSPNNGEDDIPVVGMSNV